MYLVSLQQQVRRREKRAWPVGELSAILLQVDRPGCVHAREGVEGNRCTDPGMAY